MSVALGLFRLQQVDRQLDKAQARLAAIQETLANDSQMREALSRLEKEKAAHHQAERGLKDTEADVKAQQIKIEQNESSLYGGRVQNPKELQDLQKEVASLKKHLSTLEEREMEAMQAVDDAKALLTEAESALGTIQAKLGSEHKQLFDEQAALNKDIERLSSERQAITAQVEASLIGKYDTLRSQKRGVAVAQISDSSCSACGSALNAATQQAARSSTQFAYCPSCGRILFAD